MGSALSFTMSGWQFPQWSYGYTQMPNYNYYGHPGGYAPPHPRGGGMPFRGGRGGHQPPPPAVPKVEPGTVAAAAAAPQVAISSSPAVIKAAPAIQKGRNPVMFCNDQSKLRGLHMEWEQVKRYILR